MCQECFDFSVAHVFGMALVMKEDVAANPIKIAFLSAVGIVLHTNGFLHLIQQLLEAMIPSPDSEAIVHLC
jgi:hypothetical protein